MLSNNVKEQSECWEFYLRPRNEVQQASLRKQPTSREVAT